MFEEAFYKLRDTYVDSINEVEIIKKCTREPVKPVDPYTRWSDLAKDRIDMLRTGKYGGVGIQDWPSQRYSYSSCSYGR